MNQPITDTSSFWVRRALPMSPKHQRLTAPDCFSASPLLLTISHALTGTAMDMLGDHGEPPLVPTTQDSPGLLLNPGVVINSSFTLQGPDLGWHTQGQPMHCSPLSAPLGPGPVSQPTPAWHVLLQFRERHEWGFKKRKPPLPFSICF